MFIRMSPWRSSKQRIQVWTTDSNYKVSNNRTLNIIQLNSNIIINSI